MDFPLSPTQSDPHHDGDVVQSAPKDWTGVEEALSRLAHYAARDASDRQSRTPGFDFSAGIRVTEPSFDATPRPADLSIEPLLSDRRLLGRRALRGPALFLMMACMGSAAILAWQSYGGLGKQLVASSAPQLGWSSSTPEMNPPSSEIAAEQPSPPAIQAPAPETAPAQAAAVALAASETGAPAAPETGAPAAAEAGAPTVPAPPSTPEFEQLKTIAGDLAAARESIEHLAAAQQQLTAAQQQMAREIATLQTAEQDLRHNTSAAPPRPAAAPMRKPVAMPPQPAPQPLAAPLPRALPEPPPRPPMPVP
jgi:hypothetical protein